MSYKKNSRPDFWAAIFTSASIFLEVNLDNFLKRYYLDLSVNLCFSY